MDSNKEDVFDKIMKLPLLAIFRPFYFKYKEILLYIFFGGLTTLINIAIYTYLSIVWSMDILFANAISWFFSVLFAFITNKIWVFNAATENLFFFLKQMATFYLGRVFSLLVEEGLLFIFIAKLSFNAIIIKIFTQIVVIILNYIISKRMVFK